jgi:hypothetical protein
MLRTSFRNSTLNKNLKLQQTKFETTDQTKLDNSIRTLSPFFIRTNLKFSFFPLDWPIRVLSDSQNEQKIAIELFLKRFHLTNDFISNKILLKYLSNKVTINEECFGDLCQLNRKLKHVKLDDRLIDYLFDEKNANCVQASNLETFIDSLELLSIENYVTNDFLNCYLECKEIIDIKNFLLVVKIAEKARVVRELFKKFGILQKILFTNEIDIDVNRSIVEILLVEIVNRSNRFKINIDDDPFYDCCLNKADYKLLYKLIHDKKLVNGRLRLILNELKLAQLSTTCLYENMFSYLLQTNDLKIKEGNLKKIKFLFQYEIIKKQNDVLKIDSIKPDLMAILLQIDDTKMNIKNIKRILNCENNTYVNKSVVVDVSFEV